MKPKTNRELKLSVLVPVYNEQDTAVIVIKKVRKYLDRLTLPKNSNYTRLTWEIIIVDDGSSDDTLKTLGIFNKIKKIQVFTDRKNRGKGYAIRKAISKSSGSILVIQDADLEYHPRYLKKILSPLISGNQQVVYGTRLSHLPLNLHNLTSIKLPLNFLANKFLSWLTNLLFHTHITDMETGYKAFSRKAIQQIHLKSNGFDIEVELTTKLLLSGCTIHEVPIITRPRTYAEGKKITYQDGLQAIYYLFRYRISFYHLSVFGILLLAGIMRFWDFNNRFGFWSDQARDVLVGRIALEKLSFPLIGSFSSAGPFTFGPYWYYYSSLVALISDSYLAYWIGSSLLSLIAITFLIKLTQSIGGHTMSISAGVLAAISFENVQSTLASTQHTAVFPSVVFLLYYLDQFLKTKSSKSLFWASLFLGLAINFHYQALYLLPLLIYVLLTNHLKNFLWLVALVGTALPFTPMIIFDLQHHWWNLNHLLRYFTVDQYNIYVPNRWLTYLLIYWPNLWARVVGGFPWLASILAILFAFYLLKTVFSGRANRSLLAFSFGFLIALIGYRYFRAERNFGYTVFFQPFIFIFSSWIISKAYLKDKVLGFCLLTIVIFGSYTRSWVQAGTHNSHQTITHFANQITQTASNAPVALYDYGSRSTGCSIPLSLILDDRRLSVDTGHKIGVCIQDTCPSSFPVIAWGEVGAYTCQLLDLDSKASTQLETEDWALVSPRAVHCNTVDWWKTEPSLDPLN